MGRRGLGLVIGATALVSVPVLAQNQNDNNRTQMRGTPPGRITSLGGVRSQPGVKSAASRSFSAPIVVPTVTTNGGFSRPLLTRPRFDQGRNDQVGHGQGGSGQQQWNSHQWRPNHWNPDHWNGNGFTFHGSYSEGPFKLVFSTGGLTKIPLPHNGFIIPCYSGGWAACLPYGGLGCYFANSSLFSWGYGGIVGPAWYDYGPGTYEASVPAAGAETPQRELTPLERAALLLQTGESNQAVTAYQAYLKSNPRDSAATRALGLSLIDLGQVTEGVALIGMAYRSDATLALSPLSDDVYGRASRFRSNLGRISNYANREKSASAWLTLAVLMQAEGRDDRAATMITRAQEAGLEDQVVQEMRNALAAPRKSG